MAWLRSKNLSGPILIPAIIFSSKSRATHGGQAQPAPWFFAVLVALASLSNVTAYVATLTEISLSSGTIFESNPFVRLGSLVSLAGTEVLIFVGALAILFATRNQSEREVLQAISTGIFTADAVHDLVLFVTQNSYASSVVPLFMAACVPSVCALRVMGRLLPFRPPISTNDGAVVKGEG